jgi:hypothetical protein
LFNAGHQNAATARLDGPGPVTREASEDGRQGERRWQLRLN